jgi:hypothetical protein
MKRQAVVSGTLCATVPITLRLGIISYVSRCSSGPTEELIVYSAIDIRDLPVCPSGCLGMFPNRNDGFRTDVSERPPVPSQHSTLRSRSVGRSAVLCRPLRVSSVVSPISWVFRVLLDRTL